MTNEGRLKIGANFLKIGTDYLRIGPAPGGTPDFAVEFLFLNPDFDGGGWTYDYPGGAAAITHDAIIVVVTWEDGGPVVDGALAGLTTWTYIGSSGKFSAWYGVVGPSDSGAITLTNAGTDPANSLIMRIANSSSDLTVTGAPVIDDSSVPNGASADAGAADMGFYLLMGDFGFHVSLDGYASDAEEDWFPSGFTNTGGGVVNFTTSGSGGDTYCVVAVGVNT